MCLNSSPPPDPSPGRLPAADCAKEREGGQVPRRSWLRDTERLTRRAAPRGKAYKHWGSEIVSEKEKSSSPAIPPPAPIPRGPGRRRRGSRGGRGPPRWWRGGGRQCGRWRRPQGGRSPGRRAPRWRPTGSRRSPTGPRTARWGHPAPLILPADPEGRRGFHWMGNVGAEGQHSLALDFRIVGIKQNGPPPRLGLPDEWGQCKCAGEKFKTQMQRFHDSAVGTLS